ncbi:MAG: endonuclease III domain-containing protein [Candidatus Aenigmatarchaeota archaeon]
MLLGLYDRLFKEFGPQNWWPAETPFEVIIGAILTQQTSWKNVEKAIKNLKQSGYLNPEKLKDLEINKLEYLIKPSGYYRQKAKKIKNFIDFLWKRYDGKLGDFLDQRIDNLRNELLSIKGIGKETADSIILYAANKPIFVVDAYTVRIINRIGIFNEKEYDKVQEFFQKNLPLDVKIFNEFHALLVNLGKNYCKKKQPDCEKCPVNDICLHLRSNFNHLK